MKTFVLVTAIAAVLAAPALAADIPARVPVKAPAPPPAVALGYNWTGFYIGGHVGGAWGEDATTVVTAPGILADGTLITIKPSGFLGGGQAGFNFQSGMLVLGVEVDWSWTRADDTVTVVALAPGVSAQATTEINWLATVTGRIGLATNNMLLYLKGGGAWMDVDYTAAGVLTAGGAVVLGPAVISDNRQGWVAGGGLEFGFWNNWSAKIEYNYLDFGSDRYTFVAPGATATTSADSHIHLVKGGINYRFNWGSPVVARY